MVVLVFKGGGSIFSNDEMTTVKGNNQQLLSGYRWFCGYLNIMWIIFCFSLLATKPFWDVLGLSSAFIE